MMADDAPLLELREVVKTYGEERADKRSVRVLDGISLRLSRGCGLAVTGPSGSGKSTLLNLVGALDRPTAGEVFLEGRALGVLSDAELADVRRSRIGFVFQLHHLLPQCTVLENVLVPTLAGRTGRSGESARERALSLLARVGLEHRLDHRPAELSGGERQRVAVVRALINRPALVLADEPTGALDHESARRLGALLVEMNREQGAAMIVVTHSEELAVRFGERYELRDGRLSGRGGSR
jgi:ABC-type lipoprotein export system ATPase subunit